MRVRVRRRRPQQNRTAVAAAQITAFLPHLRPAVALPWFVFDAGSDPVPLPPALGDAHAAILLRRRAGRCFSAAPTSQPRTGRARRHGHTVAGDVPATWLPPDGDLTVEDEHYGTGRVRAWRRLPPKTQGEHAQRDARGRRPLVRGTLLLVAGSRLPPPTREPQALWLWWHGPPTAADAEVPDWDRAWRASGRRFDLEHTLRFPETNAQLDGCAGAPP